MINVSYNELFTTATGLPEPFKYQEILATTPTFPEMIDIPTGLGKTAAVILGWLYRRRFHLSANVCQTTPRRLIYCLPMRTLVEQTYEETVRWLENLGMLAGKAEWQDVGGRNRLVNYNLCIEISNLPTASWAKRNGDAGSTIAVHLLMGGEAPSDWAMWPDRETILIGTQDMLLSRALNRGYAASRARWPMEFGLLHNDCLWVFDEVQLMGNGVATTAQLQAFQAGGKQSAGWGVYQACHFLWMSATLKCGWLETVDHAAPSLEAFGLSLKEKQAKTTTIGKRLHAVKRLYASKNAVENKPSKLANEILEVHRKANKAEREPILTLAVVNTVDRAIELFEEFRKLLDNKKNKDNKPPQPILIHSRFRPPDRAEQMCRLYSERPPEGVIAISTQVVEAGVDISARILFTELAPWASMVQRFGRCNRKGEYEEAEVHWIDVADKQSAPYESDELDTVRKILCRRGFDNVGPMALEELATELEPDVLDQLYAQRPTHVLRRKDLLELFDTTPDLAGNDIDVSRYIRDSEEHDVQVYWREIFQDSGPSDNAPPALRDELCSVPVGRFREFLKESNKKGKRLIWRWDFLDGKWTAAKIENVFPGQVFLLALEAGGYSPQTGWTGESVNAIGPLPLQIEDRKKNDSTDADQTSELGVWQNITEHTDQVCDKLNAIIDKISFDLPREELLLAARWHDRGKAHPAFVAKLSDEARQSAEFRKITSETGSHIAKAPKNCWKYSQKIANGANGGIRRHFRHELASALAALQAPNNLIPEEKHNLIAYLIAAHHGKVRLSIRSLPNELKPKKQSCRFARGIWEGDVLPSTTLGNSIEAVETTLNLELMELVLTSDGKLSWIEMALSLRDDVKLGPFRLAYLEAILRASDWQASANADKSEIKHV